MRTAYDSINPNDIPLSAAMVGYYTDGLYVKSEAVVLARFPNAVLIPISALGTDTGKVGDVETGDMLPWELPDWVLKRRAAGVDPTGYVNWSNWAPTRTEFHLRGIPEPHWWLASYDGIAEIPAGTVAKQYANSAISGGHYDLSAVADYWPGVDRPGTTAGSEIRVGGDQLTDAELVTMHHLIQLACFGAIDPSGQADFVNTVKAGTGMNSIFDGWWNSPASVAYRARLAAGGPPGPTGPSGPPGPPGPAGAPTGPHKHNVSGTADINT